ncbi:hypothetical protein AYL99_09128 [Fonsecaea erecta]|uniref:Protein-lysine N-methyltransferase EFM4 n=1 Tax=Fonsecaea erecta TaxID=1367422 RepID=A0A178ZC13_9EURO|nr:hypothetical protein AYL99_09128 [Fonsecaea erecta]OAP57016.1 hypothetical protein AYL99_09128 [Fonsecaea erecta]
MSVDKPHPVHLEPSELGTKEYWDEYYQNDLDNETGALSEDEDGDEQDADAAGGGDDNGDDASSHQPPPDPTELDSWFDDVGAPAKTLAFLTSTTFPLSPNYDRSTRRTQTQTQRDNSSDDDPPTLLPSVLDLGTGNGSALFALRLHGHYAGPMVGVDYSTKSVELARKLCAQYAAAAATSTSSSSSMDNIEFHELDIIHDIPAAQFWWPSSRGGFDLVLDKGTFDAISLSSSTVFDAPSNRPRRICELYPAKVLAMVKPGGFLLVTSCNWTEAEVVAWFTTMGGGENGSDSTNNTTETAETAEQKEEEQRQSTGISETGVFEVYHTIKYPVFEFGGQKGQGVASVCFRKVQRRRPDQR